MNKIKFIYHKIDGILTDADSVVLADVTASFGIRRVSDGVVIVPVNTTAVKMSTGYYEFDAVDCELAVEYEISWKVVYNGQIQYAKEIFTISSSAVEITPDNCYITLPEANIYFNNRLNSTLWTNTTDEDKARALIMATKKIDRLNLKGQKKVYTQKLAFPRLYRINPHLESYILEDIPETVKYACCEEAIALLNTELSKRKSLQDQGVKSFSLGSLSENYQGSSSMSLLSREAREYLKGWLLGAVMIV